MTFRNREPVQLPLYTVWTEGTWREIASAALHCTAGDVLIACATITGSLLLFGGKRWPIERSRAAAASTALAGIAYTGFSEWFNTHCQSNWIYSALMPTIPRLEIGLSPLAQRLVIPSAAFWLVRRATPLSAWERSRLC